MTREQKIKHIEWLALLQKIRDELAALDEAERQWLRSRLDSIGAIQLDLDTLFHAAGGVQTCAVCAGACCACGRHHLTLPNLLTYLLADEEPPAPDLDRPCPYLGESGCRLSVDRRPYNCITFFCEQLDANLSAADRQQLRLLDRQLRQEYQCLAERYPSASLRGLWIALERIDGGDILLTKQGARMP
ncbi:MAG: hypothetical protein AB1Z51_07150 [Desulfuromonadales bacterium]